MAETHDHQSNAEAARYYARLGLPIIPSHYPVTLPDLDARGRRRWACSCGTGQCPTPAQHAKNDLPAEEATTMPDEPVDQWIKEPRANVAALTGPVFGILELRYPAPACHVIDWLHAQLVASGPVLLAGPNALQLLVRPTDPAPCYAPLPSGGLLRLGGGSLVLLPPSVRVDRYPVRWHGRPPATLTGLPDSEELWAALAHLPRPDLLDHWRTGDQPDEPAPALAGQP